MSQREKILEKIMLEFKKEEREENTVWDLETAPRKYTWIQRDSNFASLRGLRSHLSL